MARKQGDQIAAVIKEVEAIAKRLRSDIRKRTGAAQLRKRLEAAAAQLRKRAATAAGYVEKYVHELRKELEGSRKPAPRRKVKRARPKKAAPVSAVPM
jgi:hypothetical protein